MGARITHYKQTHFKTPSLTATANMLHVMGYQKRFFPYYTFNVLAGLDDDGQGWVYHYDAIGSFEKLTYTASGSASSLVMSSLDSQHQYDSEHDQAPGKEEACERCVDQSRRRVTVTFRQATLWKFGQS